MADVRKPKDKSQAVEQLYIYNVVTNSFVHLILSLNYTYILEVARAKVTRIICEKVKCTFVQTLRLCIGRTAHWGSRGMYSSTLS